MASQTLSITQMYALARSAGLSPANAAVAAAIGMAESSGQTAVTSANPDGGTNVGIWQLDTKGVGAGYTVAQLQDPATNAAVMAKGSDNGTNWSDWETYVTGAYQQYLSSAQAAEQSESQASTTGSGTSWIQDVLNGLGLSGLAGIAGSVGQLPAQASTLLDDLEQAVHAMMWLFNPANWARIIAGLFGFLLLIAGVTTLALSA